MISLLWTPVEKTERDAPDRERLRGAYRGKESQLASLLGGWPLTTPYEGKLVRGPRETQIEHVVAIGWAARSAPRRWSLRQWRRFAGDIDNLTLAVPGANEDKSDKGPADWTPPREAVRFWYASRWIRVAAKHGLRFDARELAALRAMLAA